MIIVNLFDIIAFAMALACVIVMLIQYILFKIKEKKENDA